MFDWLTKSRLAPCARILPLSEETIQPPPDLLLDFVPSVVSIIGDLC